ncbi:MAG TPA: LPS export ABC transporter periplasmic protein LptC [candidate division Zixibacteria bacterium]|nr:LPS export ABC transporter periplasmic protein LptC [candidate division Zixibacteria bacterium]
MINRILTYLAPAVLLAAVGCSEREAVSDRGDADSVLVPDSEMFQAIINLSDKGVVTSTIQFEHYVQFEAIDSGMAYVVNINGYDSTGMPSGMLKGDSAVIREGTGLMDIYGNVLLVSRNGYKLQTEYLRWDSYGDEISTDEFVRITKENEWATGYGFRSDQEITRFKIMREVRGTLFGAGVEQP